MRRIRIVVGALIASQLACTLTRLASQSAPEGPRLAELRAQAIEREDYAQAVAYLDAELALYPGNDDAAAWIYDEAGNATLIEEDIFEAGWIVKRGQRAADFARLVEAERAKLGPLTDANAEAVFRRMVVLRREAQRTETPGSTEVSPREEDLAIADRRAIQPRLVEAAAVWWKQVDAAIARGELAEAIVLGATIVDQLPPGSPYAGALAELRQRAAAIHKEHARATTEAQYGARALHTGLASLFDPSVPPFSSPALVADTTLSWTVRIEGACEGTDVLPALRAAFPASTGPAATMIVKIGRCTRTTEPLPTTTKDIPYRVKVSRRVPKLTWKAQCRKVYGSVVSEYTGSGTNRKLGFSRSSMVVCDPPRHKFHGETELVEGTEPRVETVQVENQRMRTEAGGEIVIEVDGARHKSTFAIDARSAADEQYTSEHGPSKGFATKALADEALADALADQALAAARLAQGARAGGWIAKATGAAALDADHALFIAALILRQAPGELVTAMATRYRLPQDVVAAVVAGAPLPRLDLVGDQTITLPEVPADVRATERAAAMVEGLASQGLRSQLMFHLVAGPSSASEPMLAARRGAIASMSLGIIKPRGRYTAAGGGFRLGGGIDSTATGYVDFDLFYGAGLRYRGLTVMPILGLGFDGTPGYDSQRPDPEAFEVPFGGYAEYGLVARYAFASLPMTLEGMYTKAFRTSSALPRERRTELRFSARVGFPLGIVVRYADYLSDKDGVFTVSGADGRAANGYWILAGLGF